LPFAQAESTQETAVNPPSKTAPGEAPGHYGTGYGEQPPPEPTPTPPPALESTAQAPAGLEPIESAPDPDAPPAPPAPAGDDGSPVVFTPDDVTARPPDHTPTEAAPASEKAGLIFERS
jgi:hypothetical protein